LSPAAETIEVLAHGACSPFSDGVTATFSPTELSALFTDIGEQLAAQPNSAGVLSSLTDIAVSRVAGAEHAGITVGRAGEQFSTVAATSDLVRMVDEIQYDLKSGPCVDAIIANTTFKASDLRADRRWPDFGDRAFKAAGILSMLSLRLYVEADDGVIAGLNMYAGETNAFSEASETIAVLIATHGSLAVGKASAEDKAHNLLVALKNSREIGIAMGIVMNSHKVTRDDAFNLLRILSQRKHRKLYEIAADIADTGDVPELPTAR
jgi:hypothetical protein